MDRRRVLVSLGTMLSAGCLRLSSETGQTGETTGQPGETTDQTGRARDQTGETTDQVGETTTDQSTARTPTTEPDGARERTTTTGSEEDDTDSEYPLGLGDDGVSSLLVDAHRKALAGTTFRVVQTTEDLIHGEARDRTYRIDDEAEAAIVTRPEPVEITEYRTADGTVWCLPVEDDTTYGQNAVPYDWLNKHEPVEIAVQTGSFGAPERIESDPAVWRVTANGVDDPSRLLEEEGGDSVEGFSATLEVTEGSVVRSSVYEFELVAEEELRAERVEMTVSEIGELTVSDPDWVSTAREQAARLSVTIADERRAIRVSHDGGNPVVAGSQISLHGMGLEEDHAEVVEPFESGQTIFVYAEGGRLRIGRGSIPTGADPTRIPRGGEIDFTIVYRGVPYYESSPHELFE